LVMGGFDLVGEWFGRRVWAPGKVHDGGRDLGGGKALKKTYLKGEGVTNKKKKICSVPGPKGGVAVWKAHMAPPSV